MATNVNYLPPRFEGFFVQMVMPGLESRCREVVTKVLGGDWQVKPIGDNHTEFEVTLTDDVSTKDAWDKSYELRSQPGVINAEPLFTVPIPEIREFQNFEEGVETQLRDLKSEGELSTDSADNPDWSLNQLKVFETWQRFFADPNKLPGDGIIVGHPDTGYTPHPEIISNLLTQEGYNYINDNKDATDELQISGGEIINNPGHGTSSASVAISPKGAQANYPNGKYVTGVAPGARLIPLRVTYSVVLLSIRNLAEAIEYAADNGVHILTISLGAGFPNQRLRTAILYAQKRGVIVIAASGTGVPFVVYPAAYDEVIAVTGSTVERTVWIGASTGKQVDVTAPGHDVWYAKTSREKDNKKEQYTIESGSGTSFSAPFVAGVAALWLSYHGRDKLIDRYGAEKIPFIFNQLLRDTCEKFPTWVPNKYGTGIVNAEKLLDTPLPNNVEQVLIAPGFALQQYSPLDSGIDTFAHLFEQYLFDQNLGDGDENNFISRNDGKLNKNLSQLLQVGEDSLPQSLKEVGQELAFHLVTNPQLYQQFASALTHEQLSDDSHIGLRQMLLQHGISEALKRKIDN